MLPVRSIVQRGKTRINIKESIRRVREKAHLKDSFLESGREKCSPPEMAKLKPPLLATALRYSSWLHQPWASVNMNCDAWQ